MYFFKISEHQKELLNNFFKDTKANFDYVFISDYIVLYLDSDIYNCFEYLLDCFVKYGLQEDSEPNALGFDIEDLTYIFNYQLLLNDAEKQFLSKKKTKIYLTAQELFLKCSGDLDELSVPERKKYRSFDIPKRVEEKWRIDIKNKKLKDTFNL